MKKTDVCVLPEWEVLVADAINWEVGRVYYHGEIAEKVFLKQKTAKYYSVVNKAVSELTRRGVRLSNIKNVGYKVLNPDEWELEASRKIKMGGKHTDEAFLIINHAPLLRMSEEKRKSCLEMHDLIIKQKYMLSGGLIEFKTETKAIHQIRGGNEL